MCGTLCGVRIGDGCMTPCLFYMFSLARKGGSLCPLDYCLPAPPLIFRPSYGPGMHDSMLLLHVFASQKGEGLIMPTRLLHAPPPPISRPSYGPGIHDSMLLLHVFASMHVQLQCLLAVPAIIVHFFSIMYWLVVSFPSHLGCRLIISYGLPELFW